MRGHPAERHRLQQRGIVGDRTAAADVQHTAAPWNERGEREPVVPLGHAAVVDQMPPHPCGQPGLARDPGVEGTGRQRRAAHRVQCQGAGPQMFVVAAEPVDAGAGGHLEGSDVGRSRHLHDYALPARRSVAAHARGAAEAMGGTEARKRGPGNRRLSPGLRAVFRTSVEREAVAPVGPSHVRVPAFGASGNREPARCTTGRLRPDARSTRRSITEARPSTAGRCRAAP